MEPAALVYEATYEMKEVKQNMELIHDIYIYIYMLCVRLNYIVQVPTLFFIYLLSLVCDVASNNNQASTEPPIFEKFEKFENSNFDRNFTSVHHFHLSNNIYIQHIDTFYKRYPSLSILEEHACSQSSKTCAQSSCQHGTQR